MKAEARWMPDPDVDIGYAQSQSQEELKADRSAASQLVPYIQDERLVRGDARPYVPKLSDDSSSVKVQDGCPDSYWQPEQRISNRPKAGQRLEPETCVGADQMAEQEILSPIFHSVRPF